MYKVEISFKKSSHNLFLINNFYNKSIICLLSRHNKELINVIKTQTTIEIANKLRFIFNRERGTG